MCSYALCMADIILYFEVYANDKNLANLNVTHSAITYMKTTEKINTNQHAFEIS